MGDSTGKGGSLVVGLPTVMIGDKSYAALGEWAKAGAPCLKKAAKAAAPFVRA